MVLFVQLTLSTTKSAFRTLPHITLQMWSEAHARFLLGYHKLMSTDSNGRVFVISSKSWAELEGDDAKEKLVDLGRQGWLAIFKQFTFKPHTCRWEIEPAAADIDAWLGWCARSLLRLTRPRSCYVYRAQLPRARAVARHVLGRLQAPVGRDRRHHGLLVRQEELWPAGTSLLHTIVKQGEGCVPQAANMRLAVRSL